MHFLEARRFPCITPYSYHLMVCRAVSVPHGLAAEEALFSCGGLLWPFCAVTLLDASCSLEPLSQSQILYNTDGTTVSSVCPGCFRGRHLESQTTSENFGHQLCSKVQEMTSNSDVRTLPAENSLEKDEVRRKTIIHLALAP